MKILIKFVAVIATYILGYAYINAQYDVFDVYNIDGVIYKLFDQQSRYNGGAFVYANPDGAKIYSGKIVIPVSVTIEDKEYPVWGYEKLSAYRDNETEDLEVTLPEGLKTFCGYQSLMPSKIKKFNVPSTLERIERWPYTGVDTFFLRKEISLGVRSGFSVKHVTIEDGFAGFVFMSLYCDNDTLVLPGSVYCMPYSMTDGLLKCLHITKSKTGKSPIFKNHFFTNCFKIESVICEYEVPPTAEDRAFENEGDNEELGITGRATLYVPAEAIEAYRAHSEWGKFKEILPITNGVTDVTADEAAEVIATEYYDLSGRRLQAPAESGITIVATRYSDGSRRTAKLVK